MIAPGWPTGRLEHRLLSPTASVHDLDQAVALAASHGLAALTVGPWMVKRARRLLAGTRVRLGTVVAYPHGSALLPVKAFEASKALEQGATQIEFVVNAGALVSGDDDLVANDMLAVVDMAHSALATAGAVLPGGRLNDDLLRRACRLAERTGVDALITSTGTASAASTIARTRLVRESLGSRVQVKACGFFARPDDVLGAFDAGAGGVTTILRRRLLDALGGVSQPAGMAS